MIGEQSVREGQQTWMGDMKGFAIAEGLLFFSSTAHRPLNLLRKQNPLCSRHKDDVRRGIGFPWYKCSTRSNEDSIEDSKLAECTKESERFAGIAAMMFRMALSKVLFTVNGLLQSGGILWLLPTTRI